MVTRKELQDIVSKADPALDPASDEFSAQVILLASAAIGPHIKRIADLTGIQKSLVAKCSHNLRKNGIWKGGRVFANWQGEDGGVSFVMDSMVALGLFDRAAA